jgi:hypothetical protein
MSLGFGLARLAWAQSACELETTALNRLKPTPERMIWTTPRVNDWKAYAASGHALLGRIAGCDLQNVH